MDVKATEFEGVERIPMAQDREKWRTYVSTLKNHSICIKYEIYYD